MRRPQPEPGYFKRIFDLATTKFLHLPPDERYELARREVEASGAQPSLPLVEAPPLELR